MSPPRPSRIGRVAPRLSTEISGTKGRVRDLERLLAARPEPKTVGAGGIVTVAAANTPDVLKRSATVVAAGSDDQLSVKEALRMSSNEAGGDVLLLPGDFYFSDYVGFTAAFPPPYTTDFVSTGARIRGSGDSTVVWFDGFGAFVQQLDVSDLTIAYVGDPLAVRLAANCNNVERVKTFDAPLFAKHRMIDCATAGLYNPTVTGYEPGLDFVHSAKYARGNVFAMAAPNFDLFSLTGDGYSLLDNDFGPFLAAHEGFDFQAAIHVGGTPFPATRAQIRGNRISAATAGFGIQAISESLVGGVIDGNSIDLGPVEWAGVDRFNPGSPWIDGTYFVDPPARIIIRNNYGEGFDPDGSNGYLPNQGEFEIASTGFDGNPIPSLILWDADGNRFRVTISFLDGVVADPI